MLSSINLIIGLQGSGKTLFMIKEAHNLFKKGYKIVSNVALTFKYEPIDYNKIVNCEYEHCVILIDELHRLLPSRRSLSKTSVAIVDGFLSMCRKKDIIILGTTQLEYKVDCRYRDEAINWYRCTRYAYINKQWIQIMHNQKLDKNIIIGIEVLEINTYETNEKRKYSIQKFIGNKWFNFYDTHEIIKIEGLKT